MNKKSLLPIILLLSLSTTVMATETSGIVTTIKPLHSLIEGVLGDTEEAYLLHTDNASIHDFQLKPSHLKSMQQAHIIFYIDDSLEGFLSPAFEGLPDNVRTVSVAQKSGITLLPYRKNETSDASSEEHHHHHNHTEHLLLDIHIWLTPAHAIKIVALIADELIAVYPDKQAVYRANARNLINKINSLDTKLKAYLQPIQNKPFITFHDAYGYFERAYGLNYVGSITIDPSIPPSPVRIRAIQERLRETGAVCIFKEPQFSDRLIETVSEGFDIKIGELDPLGMGLPADRNLYFKLINNLAHNLRQCLE